MNRAWKRKTERGVSDNSVLNKTGIINWYIELRPMQFLGPSSLHSRATSIIHLSAL